MSSVILYTDSGSRLDLQLPWALKCAAARGEELEILVRSDGKLDGATKAIELGAEGLGAEIAAQLDVWVGEWRPKPKPKSKEELEAEGEAQPEAESAEAAPLPLQVTASLLSAAGGVDGLVQHVRDAKPDLLITALQSLEEEDAASSTRRRQVLRRVSCEILLIRAGREVPQSNAIMVPCARGPHCAAALRLARDVTPAGENFAALVVEPEIGSESRLVGRRILDRILKHALDADASRADRVVRIHNSLHVGIREEAEARRPGLILMGTSKLGAIGRRLRGTVGQRVLKASDANHVAFVRAAIPIRGRVQRSVEAALQSTVPQLEREARIDLFERVQSNSAWDFDFLALMALATLIAAAGLIENSAAVIIGAMLVAPLMTPLLGLGLSMVQGNPRLMRLAGRTVSLGFLTSLGIGFLSGLLVPRFEIATPEMVARDWPMMLDLVIAFAAGLAGAYTSSRPSLIAALPGVAIAAALVPPIATAGLALSISDFDLAGGAILLFLINAVAIVLASSFALWAVGIRDVTEGSRTTRRVTAAFIGATGLLGLYLIIFRPTYISPDDVTNEVRESFASQLDQDLRLIHVAFDRGSGERVLVIQVGGPERPNAVVVEALRKTARERFGPDLPVRVISRFEWTAED